MNKRQAKKRKQRELWIEWCGVAFKMPLLMKWKEAKVYKKLGKVKHDKENKS